MAVQEQTPQIEYVANGVTKSFPLTFDCEDQDHLIVTIDDNESSVGSWQLIDNSVVFRTAPAAGSTVTMQRNSPFERTTTYQTYNNSFRPEPVNKDLDRIWWKLQELGLADWLLSKRLDNEIQDRILADLALKADYIVRDSKLKEDYIRRDAGLKKYIDSVIALITGDPSFDEISSEMIGDGKENQKQINDKTIQFIDYSSDLMKFKPRKDGQIVRTRSYSSSHAQFVREYIYDQSSKATANNGTVFMSADSVGRFILSDDKKTVSWGDWGFEDGETYSSQEYFKPLVWGFENGYSVFNLKSDVTLSSAITINLDSSEFKSVSINAGLHIYNYGKPLTEATTCLLIYGGANVSLSLDIKLNCDKMGQYIDKPILVRPLFVSGFKRVDAWVEVSDVYGYGLFCDSPDLEIHHYISRDCWGNNVIKNTPSFDAYGDGLYLSCLKAIVHNPKIANARSISRAGIVVEALVANKKCNVTINNPEISGYDRGIHAESMQKNTELTVEVNGGSINECNTQSLVFALNEAKVKVTLNSVNQETLIRPNPTIPHDFPAGHFMISGHNAEVITNSCTFGKHIAASQVIGNSSYASHNDTWLKDSKSIAPAWCSKLLIRNMNATQCEDPIVFGDGTKGIDIDGMTLGGSLSVDWAGFGEVIKNVKFAVNSTGFCGLLTIGSNIGGCDFSDFTFHRPPANWYAVDNQWVRSGAKPSYDLNNPKIDNFLVYGGILFKNTSIDYKKMYRRNNNSYSLTDETTVEHD